jgi:hypothetical protein
MKLLILCIGLILSLSTSAHALDVTLQWDANEESDLAGYRIYYRGGSSGSGVLGNYNGTGANEGDSPIEIVLSQDENTDPETVQYTVSNLPDGLTYFFVLTAYDKEVPSNESGPSDEVDTDSSSPDTVPPVISDVQVVSTTETAAVIQWTTDEPSTSAVQYDDSSNIWDSYLHIKSDATLVTDHQINLTGLMGNMTYYFRVGSADGAGNGPTVSLEKSFTTSSSPDPGTVDIVLGDVPEADYTGTCRDTFINSGSPTVNASEDPDLRTYTWPTNTVANRTIIKWDLNDIPKGAKIMEATLSLYMYGYEVTGGDDNYEISVHKIVNKHPEIASCTWNTYDGINPWTGGSDGGAQDISFAESTIVVDKSAGYRHWNITEMVQEWVSSPSSNFGLLLNADSTAETNSNRYFRSTDYSNPAERPKLSVTYSCNVCPNGLRITGR